MKPPRSRIGQLPSSSRPAILRRGNIDAMSEGGVMRASRLLCGLGLVLAAGFFSLAPAEEPKEPPKDISEAERAKHLAHMKEVAGSIRLLADPGREDSAVKLVEKPILRYADD